MQWRPLRRLTIPLLLLIAAVALRPRFSSLDPPYRQLADWLPWLTLGATLLLGAYFNRSRIFAAALFLLAAYAVIQTEL